MSLENEMLARVNTLAKAGALGATYKRGPQGNSITDWHAEYLEKYGHGPKDIKLGSPDIPDLRDQRDPQEVGTQYLDERARQRIKEVPSE